MSNIAEFEPKKVFKFFEEISKIPRGSGNTSKIADYCLEFAKSRGFSTVKDDAGNIVIFADGTKGYENSETVILQGHLDMVCEKTADCDIDMQNEPIKLCSDGEYIWADKTTLGADDGIAIAYMLAILDSPEIPHPPLELLLTNDEEVGLVGASAFDASILKGKKLINIDSEEEGVITVSCAGGVRAFCELPLDFVKSDSNMNAYKLEIKGLLGGHSGIDINKNRANANIILARLLNHISKVTEIYVSEIDGGKKTNVIAKYAGCVVCVDKMNVESLKKAVEQFSQIITKEMFYTEQDIKVEISSCEVPEYYASLESTRRLIFTVMQIPDGIQGMNPDIPEMVQTSLNLGELSIDENTLKMGFLVRSNDATGKQRTAEKLVSFVEYLGGSVDLKHDYPAWEYRPDSPLRDIMVSAYEEVYFDKPQISALHAGIECGVIGAKLSDIDMTSIGPQLLDVHTPFERMSIGSAERCWRFLLKALEKCK